MKIKSIKPVGRRKVYDISVENEEQYFFDNGVVSHNTGTTYAADSIFIIGKSQAKNNKNELEGYNFTLVVDKSRFIKEKSKIGITVHYDKGILKYSGLFDIAKNTGFIKQCKVGRSGGWKFTIKSEDEEEIIDENTWVCLTTEIHTNKEFWDKVFEHSNLREVIEAFYKIPVNLTVAEEQLLQDNAEIVDVLEQDNIGEAEDE